MRVAHSRTACGWSSWGSCDDDTTLVDAVSAALRLREQRSGNPEVLLTEYLATRQLLLVLDNCEHVVAAAAALSETLLRSCPELRILATSREPLAIGGEAVLRVPPLTVPEPERSSLQGLPQYEAVTLFVERAATAVPGFELTEDNHVAVARICRRLDGLPLAIELAAVRLRVMSAEQILQRLTDRYRLLTVGSPGRAEPAADPAAVHRLEPRAVYRGGTRAVGAAVGVRRRLRTGRGGGNLRRRPAGRRTSSTWWRRWSTSRS